MKLEDIVNKWNAELDERTKEFVSMAGEVKAWDAVLISNGDKVGWLLVCRSLFWLERMSTDRRVVQLATKHGTSAAKGVELVGLRRIATEGTVAHPWLVREASRRYSGFERH
jgi:hypothetical protein